MIPTDEITSTSTGSAKLDIPLNGDRKLTRLDDRAHREGVRARPELTDRLKDLIPSRQLFKIAIQASIGSRSHRLPGRSRRIRKDVLKKCYGGEHHAEEEALGEAKGRKKRMKQIGTGYRFPTGGVPRRPEDYGGSHEPLAPSEVRVRPRTA